jgi:hypothetical protein
MSNTSKERAAVIAARAQLEVARRAIPTISGAMRQAGASLRLDALEGKLAERERRLGIPPKARV